MPRSLQPDRRPFAQVKLPKEAVLNCSANEAQQALCRSTIDLAHRTGAKVCAEGLTSRDDLHALIDWGCDLAMGDLLGKPQPAETLSRFLLGRAGGSRSDAIVVAVDDPWPARST